MSNHLAQLEKYKDVEMFKTCEQCGLCSSSCPIGGRDGYNIRRIIRHVELDFIDRIAATPFPWMCTTCGRCETVCPNGIAILDIIRPLRAAAPDEFIPEGPPPCRKACPGGVDVPGYLRLIATGQDQAAYELILQSVPFPGVLGRVCTHPCEDQCRRGEVNQSISICALKRYAADQAQGPPESFFQTAPDTGRKVAIVGSGPAGLTAALYLRKKGHNVTVFEARPLAGGMMRYGIPTYRLPREVLDQEIDRVLKVGIELKTGQALGRDFTLDQLKQEGFEAVFLALGLTESRKINIQGADLDGVLWGVDFLGRINQGEKTDLKDRVLVIGGGNVAVDVALTVKKLGAREVTLACLEKTEEMPANPWEVEMAVEEGINIMTCLGPKKIIGDHGRVAALEMIECLSVFDAEGRFAPVFGQTVRQIQTDQVILAIGQMADLTCLAKEESCPIQFNLLTADPETQQTPTPGLFAGGDVVSGPGAIIQALAAGKRAARSLDKFLGGDGEIEFTLQAPNGYPDYNGKRESGFADRTRTPLSTLPLAQRLDLNNEVELCLEKEQALAEAGRCLQCDLELALAKRH